ncbi:transcription antitermination factor NusB [Schaalia sp. ZJ1691]|uniref:transcription antitermination factor NusB n=1 Tax=Schaalia sp. ZJ1691 TaxID=2709404 RepID=UPI0013ED3CFF|nr:transcription antitermination factor NusB [Schaalia sp. ZJ1691]
MATRSYRDGYRKLQTTDAPRRVAFDVLTQVSRDGAYANLALTKALRQIRREEHFDARDAAFTSELVHGTLRAQGRLDWVIQRFLTRDITQTDPMVIDLLRMGTYQLLDMRVPDHAAVSTTVDLARQHLTEGPTRMVNAVLRSITREDRDDLDSQINAIEDPDERLGVQTSHPTWIVRAIEDALVAHGYDAQEVGAVLLGNNDAPLVTLVARPGLVDPADVADEAEDILQTRVAPGAVSEYAVILEHGDPALLPSVRSGLAGAQDEGSQLAAIIAAQAPIEGNDRLWLDLCAGPGGKASLLGALGASRGAELIANEMHTHRARLIERATRQLSNVHVVAGDGRSFGGQTSQWAPGDFDRVIVDAPCTGMGSLRRRPESRWRRQPEDLNDLVTLQRELLTRAIELVRPGGTVTYITCSPHRAETRDQVEHVLNTLPVELVDTVALAQRLSAEPLDIPDSAGYVSGSHSGRTLQLWNHRMGTDDMFVAVLVKL